MRMEILWGIKRREGDPMKAVILAGEESARLRPVNAGIPDCMVPLFDRPVLEHLILLLKKHNITDICVTLSGQGTAVTEYFGDGTRWGVRMTYRWEDAPLGTAQTVKSCSELLEDAPFLVVRGSMICDLDLTAATRFHREKGAEVTLLLGRHPVPQERGLVLTDRDGRVTQWTEKPGWGVMAADRAHTGICVMAADVLNRISGGGRLDLWRDIFAGMVKERTKIYACAVQGYWREVEDCGSYLACAEDALNGKVKLELGLERRQPGIWSGRKLPEGVTFIPPCWIGPGVEIGSGSLIGPHTVLGTGSRIGTRSMVQRTLVNAGQIADRVTTYGAVVCRGARVEDGCVLNEGSVLGERALMQERVTLMEGVRVWPGRRICAGARLDRSVSGEERRAPIRLAEGVVRGTLWEEITPELLLTLGGILGAEGQVGLGRSGGAAADMLARAAGSGIAAAGGTAVWHTMECAAQAGWLAQKERLPISLFVEQEGERICLHFFDRSGLTLEENRARALEYALEQKEYRYADTLRVGGRRDLETTSADYARDAARRGALFRTLRRAPEVAVTGNSPADRAIRTALEELGCKVSSRWRKGIPAFSGSRGGFRLTAQDESGAILPARQLLTMVALVELENGEGRLAVPAQTSAALELVAAGFGKRVLRLGKDGERARQTYGELPWLRDATFAAVRLCARMGASGERLEQLNAKIPRFCVWRREVPLAADWNEIIRRLADEVREPALIGTGVRLQTGGGWVYLMPVEYRAALKIVAEGADMDLAAELCDFYAEKAAKLDRKLEREYRNEWKESN